MSEILDKRIEEKKVAFQAKIDEHNALNNEAKELNRKLSQVRTDLIKLETAVNELIELKKAETGEKIDNLFLTEQPTTPQG